jgi:ATP-dependent Lon protease
MPSKQEDKDPKVKTPKNRRSRRGKKNKNYKINKDSDSDSDWLPPTEHHSDSGSEEMPNEDMNPRELQKFIQKIFPSEAGKERLRQLEKIDNMIDKKKKTNGKKKNSKSPTNKKKSNKKTSKKKKEEQEDEETSEDEIDDILILDDDEDDDEYDEDEIEEMLSNNMKFNIIFTVGDINREDDLDEYYEYEDEDEDEDEDEEEVEDKDDDEELEEEVEDKDDKKEKKEWDENFDKIMKKMDKEITKLEDETSEKKKEKEKGKVGKFKVKDKVLIKAKGWEEEYPGIITKVCTRSRYDIKLDDDELEQRKWKLIHAKYIKLKTKEEEEYTETLDELRELVKLRKGKGKKAMMAQLDKLSKANERKEKEKAKEKIKKEQMKNVGKLRKMLREKNVMNDFKYFKEMNVDNQQKILRRLKEVNQFSNVDKPYRLSLLESDIPVPFKATALKKINVLNYMDPGSGEYYKIKQWVDTFMRIPFGKRNNLPFQISDGRDKCGDFMEEAKNTLDKCVYGLNDAKMQIMQFIGQWMANPNAVAPPIAIKGPPGTGKTTLIKEGISKILNRPFAFLALGGATDSSFLEGHSYTYEGSTWGKIVDILLQSKTMNPVIYFDELDKISDTPKGEEITGILTHLTDTTQNSQFHDKYFSNIDFDLSKVLFIFSYNDEKKVNPILKDRMYRIHTKGYETKEKLIIARDHLIPKIEENINFEKGQIVIPDDTLTYIINEFTEKEKGVRNLKRCLEILYTKINLYTLMKKDSKMFDGEVVLHIEFPYTIAVETVKKLIKNTETNTVPFGMYI